MQAFFKHADTGCYVLERIGLLSVSQGFGPDADDFSFKSFFASIKPDAGANYDFQGNFALLEEE